MSVKNMIKYLILLHFYVSLLKKHKKYKNTRSNQIKKKSNRTLAL